MAELRTEKRADVDPIRSTGSIKVRIIDERQGLTVLENVYAIRIHSRNYVLLIMKDYSPTLGQIDGDVIFLVEDGEKTLKGIKGCFKQQENEFTMIIEEEMV